MRTLVRILARIFKPVQCEEGKTVGAASSWPSSPPQPDFNILNILNILNMLNVLNVSVSKRDIEGKAAHLKDGAGHVQVKSPLPAKHLGSQAMISNQQVNQC